MYIILFRKEQSNYISRLMNFHLAKKYLNYQLFSWHKYGHGIHSPFVYSLIRNVFQDKKEYLEYQKVSKVRKDYLKSDVKIEIIDFGAGSTIFKDNKRKLSQLAKVSAMTDKYGKFLFRLVKHFEPKTIIELGSCIGIGTSWQAMGNAKSKVFTIEGDPSSHSIAKQTILNLGLTNVNLLQGTFENELPKLIESIEIVDFVFIDGNHRAKPTLAYFNMLKPKLHKASVVVFDDIHLTKEMESAWNTIKTDVDVVITFDIFRFGIVFFDKTVAKQNFVVRY